jgi:hypothetical protein
MDDATAKIFDALARIEHKVDCVIATHGIAVPPMRDDALCPCCMQRQRYETDFGAKAIIRTCGCGHGKTAPMAGFKDVAPLIEGEDRGNHHTLRRQQSYADGDESDT